MTKDEIKQAVATRAAEFVTNGMTLGIGTGSTAGSGGVFEHILVPQPGRRRAEV